MAYTLKKAWLSDQLLDLLSTAQTTRIAFKAKGYMQARVFHNYRFFDGDKERNPDELITADVSDSFCIIHCMFTRACEKKLWDEKHCRLTKLRGAILSKVTGYLCIAESTGSEGLRVYLEIHALKPLGDCDGAVFGEPYSFNSTREAKSVLNSHHILRLLKPISDEGEIRSQASQASTDSLESAEVISTQAPRKRHAEPSKVQSTGTSPASGRQGFATEDTHKVPTMKQQGIRLPYVVTRRRLHTGWGDFSDLTYYDCQISAAQQSVLDTEACWRPQGDYVLTPVRYKPKRRLASETIGKRQVKIDLKSRRTLESHEDARIMGPETKEVEEEDEDEVISWAESPEPEPIKDCRYSAEKFEEVRRRLLHHSPPPDSSPPSEDHSGLVRKTDAPHVASEQSPAVAVEKLVDLKNNGIEISLSHHVSKSTASPAPQTQANPGESALAAIGMEETGSVIDAAVEDGGDLMLEPPRSESSDDFLSPLASVIKDRKILSESIGTGRSSNMRYRVEPKIVRSSDEQHKRVSMPGRDPPTREVEEGYVYTHGQPKLDTESEHSSIDREVPEVPDTTINENERINEHEISPSNGDTPMLINSSQRENGAHFRAEPRASTDQLSAVGVIRALPWQGDTEYSPTGAAVSQTRSTNNNKFHGSGSPFTNPYYIAARHSPNNSQTSIERAVTRPWQTKSPYHFSSSVRRSPSQVPRDVLLSRGADNRAKHVDRESVLIQHVNISQGRKSSSVPDQDPQSNSHVDEALGPASIGMLPSRSLQKIEALAKVELSKAKGESLRSNAAGPRRNVSKVLKFDLSKLQSQDDGLGVQDLLKNHRANFLRLRQAPPVHETILPGSPAAPEETPGRKRKADEMSPLEMVNPKRVLLETSDYHKDEELPELRNGEPAEPWYIDPDTPLRKLLSTTLKLRGRRRRSPDVMAWSSRMSSLDARNQARRV